MKLVNYTGTNSTSKKKPEVSISLPVSKNDAKLVAGNPTVLKGAVKIKSGGLGKHPSYNEANTTSQPLKVNSDEVPRYITKDLPRYEDVNRDRLIVLHGKSKGVESGYIISPPTKYKK